MAAQSNYWRVHTESPESPFIVNALIGEWASLTIGDRTTARFDLHDDGTLTVASGETYTVTADTAEFYETVTVEDSGTLNVDGELVVGSQESRFQDLNGYVDYAGQAANGVGLNNVPWFKEQLPSDARVNSIVLGFEPSQPLKDRDVRGFWGLAVGGRDGRNSVLSSHQLEFELIVLDEFGQYANVSDVKNDLEA